MTLALDDAARVAEGVRTVPIGDDLLVVGPRSGVVPLTGVAAIIWPLLERGELYRDVVDDLSAASGATAAVVTARLSEVVTQLQDAGVIEHDHGADAAVTHPAPRLPEVGRPLPDAELTTVDGELVLLEALDRPTLIVHWDATCAHCIEVADTLSARRTELDHHGVTLLLVDGTGRETFRYTGTPTAFLVDGDGLLVRPMAAGTRELLAVVDDLCGVAIPPVDPAAVYLSAPAAMCVPGDPRPLTRSQWAATLVYSLHGARLGLRVSDARTGELLDRLFPGARIDDPHAPVHYSVALSTADGDASPNVLASGGSELLRSASAARVVAALLAQLSDDLALGEHTLPSVAAAAVVRDGAATLVPWATRLWSPEVDVLLAACAATFADGPYPLLDLADRAVVVPAPLVDHDATVLQELDARDDATALDPAERRVRPGRYPLTGWCFAGTTDRPLPLTGGVARALECLGGIADVGESIEALSRALAPVAVSEITFADEADFVRRVVGAG